MFSCIFAECTGVVLSLCGMRTSIVLSLCGMHMCSLVLKRNAHVFSCMYKREVYTPWFIQKLLLFNPLLKFEGLI